MSSGGPNAHRAGQSGGHMEVDTPDSVKEEDAKRKVAKKLIERYYYQLTKGCGRQCDNPHCASSNLFRSPLDPNAAAAQALHLLKIRARLCEPRDPGGLEDMEVDRAPASATEAVPGSSGTCTVKMSQQTLDHEKLECLLAECKTSGNYAALKQCLWEVFSSQESLANSWSNRSLPGGRIPLARAIESASAELRKMTKEEVRSLEGEKDVDCSEQEEKKKKPEGEEPDPPPLCTLDLDSLRKSYESLFSIDNSIFESGLVNAVVMLCSNLEMDLKCKPNIAKDVNFLNVYEIVFELPVLGSEAYLENVVPVLCRGVALLPLSFQVALARSWSRHSAAKLRSLLENLQQILSLKVYTGTFTRDHLMNEDETITAVTSVIRILYYANLLAVEREPPDSWDTTDPPVIVSDTDTDNFASVMVLTNSARERYHDPMATALEISTLDVRHPLIPMEEFYNEPLNETIEMDKDFACWKITADSPGYEKRKFAFMAHPYILNPATKAQALYYDNRIRMYSERRMNLFQSMMGASQSNPYLRLQVRRDHIVEDALVELEVVVMENPQDLKKQLVVEFDAEQGIDEGGLSKEFFQLIVEEIFNPDFGMFIHDPDTHTFWFNPTSFESDAQFTLIGIVLGLAIYNNVILNLHLPSVIYRKLLGKRGTFQDLKEFKPSVHQGLQEMLNYDGPDFEDVFMQSFQISYTDLFGTVITQELGEGGADRMVTRDNAQEYVDRYADFLLNTCVAKQFLAFQKGFCLVTAESPLSMLFTPSELEMLICGEKEFDFNELESSTAYDGGFSRDTPCVRWFWETVHGIDLEDKRRLLQFTTGSDRIPVGGLARLKLIIAKNGPDSDRLPSAHTCFNVLLLPEYSSKDKLVNLLMKAIKECKGFGML